MSGVDGMTDREGRAGQLETSLAAVRARLADAAEAASRNADDIKLLPITKFFPATDVAILAQLGCREFGESRDQEASAKAAELISLDPHRLRSHPLVWHMVGRIQRNKARSIAQWAHTVHSVDSIRLLDALDRGAAQALADGTRDAPMEVYIQLDLDAESSDRSGVPIDQTDLVDDLCGRAAEAEALAFVGVMAIPPLGADPEQAFARLAKEHRRIQQSHPAATGLSAGMSGDLETAVKHGSTCVRVGTALMGPRPLPSP